MWTNSQNLKSVNLEPVIIEFVLAYFVNHVIHNLRATSHTSYEPWPWNCDNPKESVQRPSQRTSKITECGHRPSTVVWSHMWPSPQPNDISMNTSSNHSFLFIWKCTSICLICANPYFSIEGFLQYVANASEAWFWWKVHPLKLQQYVT